MFARTSAAACALLFSVACAGTAISVPGEYYVSPSAVEVHLAPRSDAKVTNRLYRGNRVDVFEVRDGWARISKSYDGRVEGVSGRVARWVAARNLTPDGPRPKASEATPSDSRISGIPMAGQGGLTKEDVQVLHRAARHYVDSGRCRQVVYADKSVSRAGTYYVNCGGAQNLFFRPSDIP